MLPYFFLCSFPCFHTRERIVKIKIRRNNEGIVIFILFPWFQHFQLLPQSSGKKHRWNIFFIFQNSCYMAIFLMTYLLTEIFSLTSSQKSTKIKCQYELISSCLKEKLLPKYQSCRKKAIVVCTHFYSLVQKCTTQLPVQLLLM